VSRILAVLAATLVVAAGAGCSDDDDDGVAAGTTTTAATTAVEEPAATTAEEPTSTQPVGPTATRPEPPADQTRWAQQVDAACKPWQERIDALAPPADPAELEPFLADAVPLARRQVAAVAAVKPPTGAAEARQAALFLAALRDLERGLTRYLAAIRRDDAEAVQVALTQAGSAGAQVREYAVALDVTECGGYGGG
jgi:hypothetical protein